MKKHLLLLLLIVPMISFQQVLHPPKPMAIEQGYNGQIKAVHEREEGVDGGWVSQRYFYKNRKCKSVEIYWQGEKGSTYQYEYTSFVSLAVLTEIRHEGDEETIVYSYLDYYE